MRYAQGTSQTASVCIESRFSASNGPNPVSNLRYIGLVKKIVKRIFLNLVLKPCYCKQNHSSFRRIVWLNVGRKRPAQFPDRWLSDRMTDEVTHDGLSLFGYGRRLVGILSIWQQNKFQPGSSYHYVYWDISVIFIYVYAYIISGSKTHCPQQHGYIAMHMSYITFKSEQQIFHLWKTILLVPHTNTTVVCTESHLAFASITYLLYSSYIRYFYGKNAVSRKLRYHV